MASSINTITFDCADAARLAGFWADVTGWDIGPEPSPQFAVVGGPARPADCPSLMFIQVPEGKMAKNRVHLDLAAEDRVAEVDRLVGLGATLVHEKEERGVHWSTLQDPEGNEFCVAAPHRIDAVE